MNEFIWKRAERDSARRERLRLIRLGRIRHVSMIRPQLMVRNDAVKGGWSPELKIN